MARPEGPAFAGPLGLEALGAPEGVRFEQGHDVLAPETQVPTDRTQARQLAGGGPVDNGALGHIEQRRHFVAAQQRVAVGGLSDAIWVLRGGRWAGELVDAPVRG